MLRTNWMVSLPRFLSYLRIVLLISLAAMVASQSAGESAAQSMARPPPPTRDPHTAAYVAAKELPDGTIPATAADGNFIIGPTHNADPGMSAHDDVPQG